MLLAFFEYQCRGVKFYRLKDARLEYWTSVLLVCEPENEHDCFCVAVRVPRAASRRVSGMLGHETREATRWFSPLLLCRAIRVRG